METYITTNEARRQLGISRQAIHYLIKEGKLTAIRCGKNGRIHVSESQVLAYRPRGRK